MHDRRHVTGERRPPGKHLIQRGPERIDVTCRGRLTPGQQLGRQIRGGAQDGAGGCPRLVADDPCDAEVRQLHLAAIEQNVRRLEIPVHNARRVRRGQPVADLRRDPRGLRGRQRAAAPLPTGVQVTAADQLHHERELVTLDDHVVQRHDGRVPEPHQHRALANETCHRVGIGSVFGAEQLDRERVPRDLVPPPPHDTHAALPYLLIEQIATPQRPDGHGPGSYRYAAFVTVARGARRDLYGDSWHMNRLLRVLVCHESP